MHYINIIDCARPDDFFMFMSERINSFNIQRNNRWTLCKINDDELTVNKLSSYLSDYIWENTLPKLCLKLLCKNSEVLPDARKDIVSRTMNVAFCMKSNTTDIVREKLSEYLASEYSFLSIDGFLLFRLKGLIDDLRTLLNIAIYENYAEDEYNEFVSFMKEIVSEQSPICEEIFMFEERNGFKILDEEGRDITDLYPDKYFIDKNKTDFNYYDSLISSVISIAPKKIYMHCSDEMFMSTFCELIKGIFAGKVIKC